MPFEHAHYASFFDWVDDVMPPWSPDKRNMAGGQGELLTRSEVGPGQHEVMGRWYGVAGIDPPDKVGELIMSPIALSTIPFIRAIDPSGLLCALKISQTRWPEGGAGKPEAVHDTGYSDRIQGAKRRAGWLFAERSAAGDRQMTVTQYGHWLYEQTVERRRKHREADARILAEFESRTQREQIEATKKQTEQMGRVVEAMATGNEAIVRRLESMGNGTHGAPGTVTLSIDELNALIEAQISARLAAEPAKQGRTK